MKPSISSPVAMLLVAALATVSAAPGWAAPAPTPESIYQQGVSQFKNARFERSIELLEQARKAAKDPSLLGRICLQLGLSYAVMDHKSEAAESFRAALIQDPRLTLDSARTKQSIMALFLRVRSELTGDLRVRSSLRGAAVLINGEEVGRTPFHRQLEVGAYTVVVRGAGGQELVKQITLRANRTATVMARFVARSAGASSCRRGGRLWTWVSAGAAVTTLVLGLGFGISAMSDHAEWEDLQDMTREEHLEGLIEGKSTAANVLYGVGGALAAASAALYFLEPWLARRGAHRRAYIGPLLGDVSGLSLGGRF